MEIGTINNSCEIHASNNCKGKAEFVLDVDGKKMYVCSECIYPLLESPLWDTNSHVLKIDKNALSNIKDEIKQKLGLNDSLAQKKIYDTSKFPRLEGISICIDDFINYCNYKGVYIKERFAKDILFACERDKPICVKGEPGDGKSLTAKTFFNWLTLNQPLKNVKLKNKRITIHGYPALNTFMTKNHYNNKWGLNWKAINIDESISPLQLFGGFAPESIGGGIESRLNRVVEWGIISECIMEGSYLFMDELNRGENEAMQKMLGAFAEPYFYEVPQADSTFIIKDTESNDVSLKRSNFVIFATMNAGDKGNFDTGYAFKRRWVIVELKYSTEETIEILCLIYSKFQSTKYPFTTKKQKKIKEKYEMVCTGRFSTFLNQISEKIRNIIKLIYERTHVWKSHDKLCVFGAGISHIQGFLEDMSLEVLDLCIRVFPSEYPRVFTTPSFRDVLKKKVHQAVLKNIINTLTEENDLYRTEQLVEKGKDLTDLIVSYFHTIFSKIAQNCTDKRKELYNIDNPSESSQVPALLTEIFDFSQSVEIIYNRYYN